jgi:hypothetical protein
MRWPERDQLSAVSPQSRLRKHGMRATSSAAARIVSWVVGPAGRRRRLPIRHTTGGQKSVARCSCCCPIDCDGARSPPDYMFLESRKGGAGGSQDVCVCVCASVPCGEEEDAGPVLPPPPPLRPGWHMAKGATVRFAWDGRPWGWGSVCPACDATKQPGSRRR